MSVSKLILSSARRYIAYASVEIYMNHSFDWERERERERERDDDDDDDDDDDV